MKRTASLFSAIALGALLFSGCVTEDSIVTCDQFDDILYECTWNCGSTWDCEDVYDLDLTYDEKDLMDCCSDCMHDEIFVNGELCGDANDICSTDCLASTDCLSDMDAMLGGVCSW